MLGEGRQVNNAYLLAHAPAFVADVLEVIRAPETPFVLALHASRCKPVGALPAVALAPDRTELIQAVVDRTGLGRAGSGPLLVREMYREDFAVSLFILAHHVALGGVGTKPPRVDRQKVDAGLAFHDPLGQLPARTARCGDTEAVPFIEPQVALAPARSDQRAPIRRIRDRTVDDVLDAAAIQGGHP